MVEMDARTVTLLDGAMGTSLHARGLPPDTVPERWLLDRLSDVVEVHRAHVAAGARAVLTCTFNVHPPVLRPHRLHTFCGELRRIAVEAARQAHAPTILGVVGPLPPSVSALQVEAYAEAAGCDLAAAGVTGLVVETITSLEEGVARVRGAAVSGLPVVATLVPGTAAASDVRAAVNALTRAGAGQLGVNCDTPQACYPVLADMAALGAQSLWAKPSAGLPAQKMDQAAWVEATWRLLKLGVSHVGGCCGVDAAMLRALNQALRRLGHQPD
jgi:methionine synthase I (cobalamin-dependent)